MSIVPGPREPSTWHPLWCAKKHDDPRVHDRKVGVDLELSGGVAYRVGLQQVTVDEPGPTEVLIHELTSGQTSLTRMSLYEASALRDLLTEALAMVGQRRGSARP